MDEPAPSSNADATALATELCQVFAADAAQLLLVVGTDPLARFESVASSALTPLAQRALGHTKTRAKSKEMEPEHARAHGRKSMSERGLTGQVLLTKSAVALDDATASELFDGSVDGAVDSGARCSLLAVPLFADFAGAQVLMPGHAHSLSSASGCTFDAGEHGHGAGENKDSIQESVGTIARDGKNTSSRSENGTS